MERFRRHLMLVTVLLVAFLVYASALSAFYGSARAAAFFNSPGMVAFWVVLLLALAVSFVAFNPSKRKLGSLLVHLACILIIAGSMWGSASGHLLRQKLLGENRVYEGYITIHEGYSEDRLLGADETAIIGKLPFSMALKRFFVEYYPSQRGTESMPRQYRSTVAVASPTGKEKELRIEVNHPLTFGGYTFYQYSFGEDALGRYTILHVRALSGMPAVYAGFVLLVAGLVWSLWIKNLLPVIRSYRPGRYDED